MDPEYFQYLPPWIIVVILITPLIWKGFNILINKIVELNRQKELDEEKIKTEGKEIGMLTSKYEDFKANSEVVKEEYYKQQKKNDELDAQISILSKSLNSEIESRKLEGERIDKMINIYENLSNSYSEMSKDLKDAVTALSTSLSDTNSKIKNMEKDLNEVKEDIKEIKYNK